MASRKSYACHIHYEPSEVSVRLCFSWRKRLVSKLRIDRLSSILLTIALLAFLSPSAAGAAGSQHSYFVYVGTYTDKGAKGIYSFQFDADSGKATIASLSAETTNPSFLALDRNGRFLYAVNEVSDYQGKKGGAISAFAVDDQSGKLTLLNQVSSRGAGPCHLEVDGSGKFLLVANYDAGNVAVFPISRDGHLDDASQVVQHSGHGPNAERQEGPHAHEVELSRDNRFAFVADLGLDKILVYRFDPVKGTLIPNTAPFATVEGGAGPRHFAFDPSGKFLYLITEMHSAVDEFSYEPGSGTLKELQTISALPAGYTKPNDAAEIAVHPNGKFVYSSNRGDDSIAVFSIAPDTGKLALVETTATRGKTPRNFAIDPTGKYLLAANQESNSIVVFRIDESSGKLTPTGQVIDAPSPVCIVFRAQ
jgi:6-phosphogluconolactonase